MFEYSKLRKLIIILILPILLLASFEDVSAAKKKKSPRRTKVTKYNPSATRAQAIEIIKSNSASVSELAGLESKVGQNNDWLLNNDGEDLYDPNIVGDYGEDIAELEKRRRYYCQYR
jgi:hypothetical protein